MGKFVIITTIVMLLFVSAIYTPRVQCRHVRPIVECVTAYPEGYAFFGYYNSKVDVTIPIGTWNRFEPLPADRGQPTRFLLGRYRSVIRVSYNTSVTWYLGGNIATVDANSPICKKSTVTPTSTPTTTPTPTSTTTPTPTATTTPTPAPTTTPSILPQIYVPVTSLNHGEASLAGLDLIVWNIVAHTDTLKIIIKNVGDVPTDDPYYALWGGSFWVDTYVDPDPVPDRVNQTWEQVSEYGSVHGVTVVLEPGDMLVLEIGDIFYWGEHSNWESPLELGTIVCVQVDSANAENPEYGALKESHEIVGGTYNNIMCTSVWTTDFNLLRPNKLRFTNTSLPPR